MRRKRQRRRQTNYEKGRYYEYKERDYWRALGYYAARAYGSYGAWDVVASNGQRTLFIQVKSSEKSVGPNKIREAQARFIRDRIPNGPNVDRMVVIYQKHKPRREIIF